MNWERRNSLPIFHSMIDGIPSDVPCQCYEGGQNSSASKKAVQGRGLSKNVNAHASFIIEIETEIPPPKIVYALPVAPDYNRLLQKKMALNQ